MTFWYLARGISLQAHYSVLYMEIHFWRVIIIIIPAIVIINPLIFIYLSKQMTRESLDEYATFETSYWTAQ